MFKQHLIIFVAVVTMTDVMVIQQSYAQANTPKSNIVNSVYLTIKDQKFGIKDSVITGTIVNNSTYQIKLAQVYALLYNGNHLITVVSGLVDVTTLNPGDNSAFVISLLGLSSSATRLCQVEYRHNHCLNPFLVAGSLMLKMMEANPRSNSLKQLRYEVARDEERQNSICCMWFC